MLENEATIVFSKEMAKVGLDCSIQIFPDGEFHRFKVENDRSKSCWYKLTIFPNGVAFGIFGCFKRGISESWCSRSQGSWSAYDRKLIDDERQKSDKRLIEMREQAKQEVLSLWGRADRNVLEHKYLQDKQIKSYGLRLLKDRLLVPLFDENMDLSSLQFITTSGAKWFKRNALVKGSYHVIGRESDVIYLAEGYATAATIHEVTGCMVFVAFCANNLKPVAQIVRNKYPDNQVVICADNDQWTANNPGLAAAKEAAKLIGAKIVMPQFSSHDGKPTDFNDLFCREGIEVTQAQLNNPTEIEETLEETIERLAKLTPLEYDQQREQEAKRLKVRVTTLDQQVDASHQKLLLKDKSGNNPDELENDIEPYSEAVIGDEIAQQIEQLFKDHLVISVHQCCILALWVIGSYCFDCFNIFPKLLITSPEKRCGKTRTMELLQCLVHKSLVSSNITPAAIFRAIELWGPTLLIDEADTFIRSNPELIGIINSGHSKSGAFVIRTEGDSSNRMPKRFSTWAPMVIAMIKKPADTIIDRSIVIALRRKLSNNKVKNINSNLFNNLKILRQQLKRWVLDNSGTLTDNNPIIPQIENDRAIDNWRPLFAIANILGAEWIKKINDAFISVTASEDDESISIILLGDIKEIFVKKNVTKIHSDDLVSDLNSLEGRPWCEWNHGKPMTKNTLAKLLKSFGIKPHQVWIGINKNGYELSDFEDTFERYLPAANDKSSRALESAIDEPCGAHKNSSLAPSLGFLDRAETIVGEESRVLGFQGESLEQGEVEVTI